MHNSLVGEFMKMWADLERREIGKDGHTKPTYYKIRELMDNGTLSKRQIEQFNEIRKFRNNLVHGISSPNEKELKKNVRDLKEIIGELF